MVAIALIASAMLAGPTLAHHRDGHQTPPGQSKPKPKPGKPPVTGAHDNRGTIKVHEGAGEPSPVMRNMPQVCAFHIHMFKFYPATTLTVSIVGHGGNAGASQLDAATVVTDANGAARYPTAGELAGWADGSYKVSVDNGRGGPGKQDKHKVFKVDCADDEGTQPPPGSGEAEPPPGGGDEENPNPGDNNQGNNPNPGDSNQGNNPTPGDNPVTGAPPAGPVPGNGPNTGPTPPKPGSLPDSALEADSTSPAMSIALAAFALAACGGYLLTNRRRAATR